MTKNEMMKILKNDIYFEDIFNDMRDSFFDIIQKCNSDEENDEKISSFVNELKIDISL